MVNKMDQYKIHIIEINQDITEKADCIGRSNNSRKLQKCINDALGYEFEYVQLIPITINQYNQVYYLILKDTEPHRIKTNQQVYGR